MRYRLFRRRSTNLYYFQILTDANTPILNSQGYSDKEARNNGLRSVVTNAGNSDRYERMMDEEGNPIFVLKAVNGQEIGRSTGYSTEADRDEGIVLFQKEAPELVNSNNESTEENTVVEVDEKPYEADGKEDNYKPLSFYEERITGIVDGFDIFSDEGKHYFTYNANSAVYLISEGYESIGARDNGINSVTNNMVIEGRYQREQHPNGKYYFNLRAGNNKEIATSRWFDGEGDMNTIIARMVAGIGVAGKAVGEGVQLEAANRSANIIIAAAPAVVEEAPKKKRKKRTTPKKPKAEKVYLAEGNYLFNDITYQIFRSGNDKHYFTFRNKEGKALFLNADVRGFETEAQAQAVVDQIMLYAPYEVNYEGKTTKNGKYYFYILGEEGKKLGKSFFYDSTEIMQDSVGLLLGNELQLAALAEANKGKSERVVDDYLPCRMYHGEGGFYRFYDEERKEYYFAYNDSNGTTFLRSEGYTTEKARENGINSVIKNAPIDKRWTTDIALNGKYHYYALKAGNHQEIARSCYYEEEESMKSDFIWIQGGDSPIGLGSLNGISANEIKRKRAEDEAKYAAALLIEDTRKAEAEAARIKAAEEARLKAEAEAEAVRLKAEEDAKRKAAMAAEAERKAAAEEKARLAAAAALAAANSKKVNDDYLPCKSYHGDEGFNKFQDERTKEYYFSYCDNKGAVILRSEGYTTTKARDNGIESVKKNAPIESRWGKDTALNGKYHYYFLKAGNHQEIARSCYYDDEASMMLPFGWATGAFAIAAAAPIIASEPLATAPEVPKEKEDDYLACREYANKKINDRTNNVALFKHDNGQFYFALYDDEGNVRLRSEGFSKAQDRDQELSGVIKYKDDEDQYKRIQRGRRYIDVLYDKTGREIGRSCLKEEGAPIIPIPAGIPVATAAAVIPATAAVGSTKTGTVAAATPPPPVADQPSEEAGFLPWLRGCLPWLLALLLLLLLLWLIRGCFGCDGTETAVVPPVEIEEEAPVDTVVAEAEIEIPPAVAFFPAALDFGFNDQKIAGQMASIYGNPDAKYPDTLRWFESNFGFNSAKMSRGAFRSIDEIAQLLKACPDCRIEIIGNIDATESDVYNGPYSDGTVTLSGIRARCLYKKLIKRGVSKTQLEWKGQGSTVQIAENNTREGRKQNRRLDIILKGK